MNNKNYIVISFFALVLALLLFAYQKEYIVFNFSPRSFNQEITIASHKKAIPFFYWHQSAWHTEEILLIFSDNISANMQQLIGRWLQLIHEEKIVRKKIAVQASLLNFNQHELFLSFDRPPWNKESPSFEKWMIIEGLLKTIKNSEPSITHVRFLINHQPIQDIHLDFTNAWPTTGFMQ